MEVASDFDEINFREVVYENPIRVGWRGEEGDPVRM